MARMTSRSTPSYGPNRKADSNAKGSSRHRMQPPKIPPCCPTVLVQRGQAKCGSVVSASKHSEQKSRADDRRVCGTRHRLVGRGDFEHRGEVGARVSGMWGDRHLGVRRTARRFLFCSAIWSQFVLHKMSDASPEKKKAASGRPHSKEVSVYPMRRLAVHRALRRSSAAIPTDSRGTFVRRRTSVPARIGRADAHEPGHRKRAATSPRWKRLDPPGRLRLKRDVLLQEMMQPKHQRIVRGSRVGTTARRFRSIEGVGAIHSSTVRARGSCERP